MSGVTMYFAVAFPSFNLNDSEFRLSTRWSSGTVTITTARTRVDTLGVSIYILLSVPT